MNKPNGNRQDLENRIERALMALDEKDHALYLAKLALKLGHQLENPSAVATAIAEACNELDC